MNWDKIKNRLTSKVVWVAAVPLIASLVAKYAGVDVQETLMTVITLLALFGILNNPDDKEHF